MSLSPAFFSHLASQGDGLHARVLSRDDAHLGPARLTRAAAARLRTGIAALESWLRRVLLLMALAMEPDLQPDPRPWVKTHRPRRCRSGPGLRIFRCGGGARGHPFGDLRARRGDHDGQTTVWAAPMLARLSALKSLMDAPEKRARRLAFHLARNRPGPLRAPDHRGRTSGALFGTEASTLFEAMAAAIWDRSRARPPPLGPAPRAGPRLRSL